MKIRRKRAALVAEKDRLTALAAEPEDVLCPSCGTKIATGSGVDIFRACWECGLTTRFVASVAS